MRNILWKTSIRATLNGCIRNTFRSKAQCGQGVLEFVVVSASIIFFIFMFVNLCYVFLVGQYIDYSVFMAARSLNAAHSEPAAQEDIAKLTLQCMLSSKRECESGNPPDITSSSVFGPLVKFITTAEEAVRAQARYPTPRTADNLVQGVKVEYEVPLFLIPPLGILKQEDISRVSRVRITSETYLDREPTQEECYDRLSEIMNKWFPSWAFPGIALDDDDNGAAAFKEVDDNGC